MQILMTVMIILINSCNVKNNEIITDNINVKDGDDNHIDINSDGERSKLVGR